MAFRLPIAALMAANRKRPNEKGARSPGLYEHLIKACSAAVQGCQEFCIKLVMVAPGV